MAEPISLPRVVVVTGTSTDVGKTVVTAALAALVLARGSTVAVVKATQTGVGPGDPGDVDVIRALLGADPHLQTHELLRLRAPLAPDAAARQEGVQIPTVADYTRRVAELVSTADVVLAEGAGGLLVRLDQRGGTLADLAVALRDKGVSTGVVVVVAPGLGSLNHTALTAEALRTRGIPLLGLVIGSWPSDPGLAERSNLEDLPSVAGAPLIGRVPAGAGALDAAAFRYQSPGWFTVH
ncbi:MAG TPA: dethiobiotin synthase [Candidatus Lustribacter sp.]|nr:dethiobiotin synthase [Candidatus Lustribacter sp.]